MRSKALLEKDNKRLQQEIERLKVEFANVKTAGTESQAPPDILNNILTRERKESFSKERRESLIEKRKSIADSTITDIIEEKNQIMKNHEDEHVPEQVGSSRFAFENCLSLQIIFFRFWKKLTS